MPARRKFLFSFLIALAIFLFSPKIVFAGVLINELLPNPSSPPDWVELYNSGDEAVSLEGWILIDSTSEMLTIREATISARSFIVFDVSRRLNQSSDEIRLLDQGSEEKDRYEYTSNPGTDVSFGRMPDGGSWGVCQTPTKGEPNSCALPTPTPSPTSEPTPTPKPPTSTPTSEPPTSTPTLSPTPTPKAIKVVGTTLSGEILGEEASPEAFYPWEATQEGEEAQEATPSKRRILPYIFLGLGLAFLAAAAYSLWYTKLRWPKEEG